jgi:hypothetical protein
MISKEKSGLKQTSTMLIVSFRSQDQESTDSYHSGGEDRVEANLKDYITSKHSEKQAEQPLFSNKILSSKVQNEGSNVPRTHKTKLTAKVQDLSFEAPLISHRPIKNLPDKYNHPRERTFNINIKNTNPSLRPKDVPKKMHLNKLDLNISLEDVLKKTSDNKLRVNRNQSVSNLDFSRFKKTEDLKSRALD